MIKGSNESADSKATLDVFLGIEASVIQKSLNPKIYKITENNIHTQYETIKGKMDNGLKMRAKNGGLTYGNSSNGKICGSREWRSWL